MNEQNQTTKSSGLRFLWLGLIVTAVIAIVVWGGSNLIPATETGTGPTTTTTDTATGLEPAPVAGHPAPNFTLTTLDGREVSLNEFQGRPVILNFWATWCGPCRVEMPHFQEAYTEHQDDGLVILGVNLTERDSVGQIPGFVDEFSLTFPIILDETGDVADTYNVFGQPASVFVDKNGIVQEVFYGPVNKAFIEERVSELLNS